MIFLRHSGELSEPGAQLVGFCFRYWAVFVFLLSLFQSLKAICLTVCTAVYPSPSIISFLSSHSLHWTWVKLPPLPAAHSYHYIILLIASFSCLLLLDVTRALSSFLSSHITCYMPLSLCHHISSVLLCPMCCHFFQFYCQVFQKHICPFFHRCFMSLRNFSPPCWRQRTHHWRQMKAG